MLAGELMNAGGMTRRVINMAMAWIGHIRGSLGYVAVAAGVSSWLILKTAVQATKTKKPLTT
jgi:TRAP-type C4-dicarboxylate transport system permease large subunit